MLVPLFITFLSHVIVYYASAMGFNGIKFRNILEEIKSAEDFKPVFIRNQNYYLKDKEAPQLFIGDPYPDLYLEQPLDHFDPQINETYMQRYWINADHWQHLGGPVFLFIGGEGALNSYNVQKGEHYDLAVKYSALIFAVEHRYYGKSVPKDGLMLENLQYLSSQQALADLASFHIFATEKFKLTADNTWICFGGSYPGALSAWFRIKYPHLVYGAIASSAPVHAKVNFEGYNEVVAASLSSSLVNGSLKCMQSVQQAFTEVDKMLYNKKFQELSTDFMSCEDLKSEKDVFQFASNLADIFMSTVQYNDEIPGANITTLCNYMTQNNSSVYENLKDLNRYFLNKTKQNCSDNSWSKFMKLMMNTTAVASGVGYRQWIYQTCTQFGYYQTCDVNTSCIFSQHMTVQDNLAICKEVFNIDSSEVYERVDFTNSYYGGEHPSGTRIVFVNGSIDPWHALSILKNISAAETAIFIDGTAHCANMASSKKTDPLSLVMARKKIDQRIALWLKNAVHRSHNTTLYFKSTR